MHTYGLVGYPLQHSFSAQFFTEKFSKENLDAKYLNYEIDNLSRLYSIIESDKSLKGLNVTIPYKESIIPFLDELDDVAKKIGAVNVIKIKRDGNRIWLKGYNSDIIGFQQSIKLMLDTSIHKKALVLGTGGAAKAVHQGLLNLGITSKYVSRNPRDMCLTYSDLTPILMNEYKIIINSTPLGTYPNTDTHPNIPYQYLQSDHILYDLVYNPPLTKFLELGKLNGVSRLKNGYEMLEKQALLAWQIWNNKD